MGDAKGRRTFDREFKESAVRLIVDGGRSVAEVSRSLGIHQNQLRRWRQKYLEDREHAFPGKAGCIWQRLWMCITVRSWAGPSINE